MVERRGALEVLVKSMWQGTAVLVTGHTGFKGARLTLWLAALGAKVHGYALDPERDDHLFGIAGVAACLQSDERGDIRDAERLAACVARTAPRFVFHLAAQALVGRAHDDPVGTFAANTMGTVHLLDAVRRARGVAAVVVATTDKVYANGERGERFVESDALGGSEPYGASKAACELAVEAYRESYFDGVNATRVATARAGNVIGGGDFSPDRLVPDCLRALEAGRAIALRSPGSIRPWQHVDDPLSGYLRLAEVLAGEGGAAHARAWNFGPGPRAEVSVAVLVGRLAHHFGAESVPAERAAAFGREAHTLRLDSTRALRHLCWAPEIDLDSALYRTVAWHRAWRTGADMVRLTADDITAGIAARGARRAA